MAVGGERCVLHNGAITELHRRRKNRQKCYL